MARILVEKVFDPPITKEKWNQDIEIGIPCHRAHNIHWIRSMMSCDRGRVICEFEAPDAETVRRSFRKVGLPFARIWTVNVIEPEREGEESPFVTSKHLEVLNHLTSGKEL